MRVAAAAVTHTEIEPPPPDHHADMVHSSMLRSIEQLQSALLALRPSAG